MASNRPRRLALWLLGISVPLAAFGFLLARYLSPLDPLDGAREAYAQRDWASAARLARERLKVAKDDLGAVRELARANARLGRDDSAVSLYQNRLGIDQMEGEDHLLLGTMIERQGDGELALKVWQKAAGMHPGFPELLEAVAIQSSRMQRPEVAAEAAGQLIKSPEWEARGQILLGLARSMMDDDSGAVEALTRGLKLNPSAENGLATNQHLRNVLGRNLLKLGRPADALAAITTPSGTGGPDASETAWIASRSRLALGDKSAPDPAQTALVAAYREGHPLTPEPGPFLGSSRCVSCHAEISESYTPSRHARTFHRGRELLDLPKPEGPLADPDRPGATHTVEREGDKLRVVSREANQSYQLLVDFAFGTPERYVTMVGRDETGADRALRLSHFRNADGSGWDRTSGDAGDSAHSADVRGQEIHTRDGVVRCLGCHVTNPRDFQHGRTARPDEAVNDRAIGCERCHGPGTSHVAAVEANFADPAIVNAGRAGSSAVNQQCRECHVVGDGSELMKSPSDPRWVRSPGLTLTFSRCFIQSTGTLNCLTCHDPHRDSPTDAAAYEPRCLSCHTPNASQPMQVACKVSPSKGCLGCHMPKVAVPSLHTELTDHFIRVHRDEEKAAEAASR